MANIGYIQVNRYCNNKCHFCSNPTNGKDITYDRGIELIDGFIKKGYDGIIFTGGEPTLSKDLGNWIAYAQENGMDSRVISNGSKFAHEEYVILLKKSGLRLVHISLYSHVSKIHDFLTQNPGSFKKVIESIRNLIKHGIEVQINTVINRYNQDHLDKIVVFLTKHFPSIRHFVWNNLDPLMMEKTDITITTLPDFEVFSESLNKAMNHLYLNNKTFRAERIPLCFLKGYEYVSTETRKIVKNEERLVYFLDNRETIKHKGKDFMHDKKKDCDICDLNMICAGIYESNKFYNYVKVKPRKLSTKEKENIINKIKFI